MVKEANFDENGLMSFEAFKTFMRNDDGIQPDKEGSMVMRSPSLRRRPSMATPLSLRRKSFVSNVSGKLPVQVKDLSKQIGMPSPHFSRLQGKKKVKENASVPEGSEPKPQLWG